MFRRKQNEVVQLIGVHPLGAQLDDPHSQQSDDANVSTVLSSGGMRQKPLVGLKFYNAKMNPARRSRSLEGNLDNFDVDHVTIREEDKGKLSHSSHPHGLDTIGNQLPMGRRLQIIATPPSSSSLQHSPQPATSSSPTVDNIIRSDVEIQVPCQPKKHQISDTVGHEPSYEFMTQQQSGMDVPHSSKVMARGPLHDEDALEFGMKSGETKMPIPAGSGEKATSSEQIHSQPVSQLADLPPKTNYPDPRTTKTDDSTSVFRERTDTANSAMFDISYDL